MDESDVARQLARLATTLDQQGRVVMGHMASDDRVLSEVRSDLRAIREGQSELRTDFERHVAKYDAEQEAWRRALVTPEGAPRVVAPPPTDQRLVYLLLGSALAGGGAVQGLPKLLEFLFHK